MNLKFLAHTDTVFFLFPTRIWQFGIGAALALSHKFKIKNIFLDTSYLLISLSLIFYNFIYINKFLPEATLACIGLGLILIKSENEKNKFTYIFKIKPLLFVGIISYSLYLWHWPIISFAKYFYIDSVPFLVIILSIFLIFILSSISWKYIEQPFLKKYSDKFSIKFIGINFILLVVISFTIIYLKEIPSRYEKYPNIIAQSIKSTYDCPPIKYKNFKETYGCFINKEKNIDPENILFGNSHAYMYGWPFIDFLTKNNQSGLVIQSSCLPFLDYNISSSCLIKSNKIFNSILNF